MDEVKDNQKGTSTDTSQSREEVVEGLEEAFTKADPGMDQAYPTCNPGDHTPEG